MLIEKGIVKACRADRSDPVIGRWQIRGSVGGSRINRRLQLLRFVRIHNEKARRVPGFFVH